MAPVIYLDTNAFISAYEATDARSETLLQLFDALANGEFVGVTSELTLAELLPKPLSLGQIALAAFYDGLLSASGLVEAVPATRTVLLEAARLRSGDLTLKLPDAVHVATARQRGCAAFLSNDRRLTSATGLAIVRLSPSTLDDLRRFET